VSVSVIIPTIGRRSLRQATLSARQADELVIVVDKAAAETKELEVADHPAVKVISVVGGDHGYTARAAGMAAATSTHLAFLDDDDVYVEGAIDLMREVATDRPVIFRMAHPEFGMLWRVPELRFGNVGTPMFLVPNDPEKLGEWTPHAPTLDQPGGDFTFIAGCCAAMGEPEWREDLIALVRPPERASDVSIAVVTPWMNHPELVYDYTVAMQAGRPDELIVVDNGSEPPLAFAEMRFSNNRGFSPACNAGLTHAESDAVLFLNNDIRMRTPDWLETIRGVIEPGVLVGAKIRYDRHADVDGEQYPYLDGWCLAGYRMELLGIGGFDETFQEPAYFSDNDLCLRARAAGMTLREVKVGLEHLLGVTSGPPDAPAKVAACDANYERYASRVRELVG